MKEVTFLAAGVTHYRKPFHEKVRQILALESVNYRLLVGCPTEKERMKRDLQSPDWAEQNHSLRFGPGKKLMFQNSFRAAWTSDIIIMGQENRLLHNYILQLAPRRFRSKIAFFGHGRNFQSRNPNGMAERWKRFLATKVDWWFAYTQESGDHVASLGFPEEQITVFNNATDTENLKNQCDAVTDQRLTKLRQRLDIGDGPVGIFIGGLYPDKRLEYLLEASDAVHKKMPGFTLLIVGAGESLDWLKQEAESRTHVKILGPKFGHEKAELMRLADIFLMPGLVGLAILDAAAAGLPLVTTDFPWHSPEIAYLDDGVNGLIVKGWEEPQAYANALSALFDDTIRLRAMQAEVQKMAEFYTIDAMAERFAKGVIKALG